MEGWHSINKLLEPTGKTLAALCKDAELDSQSAEILMASYAAAETASRMVILDALGQRRQSKSLKATVGRWLVNLFYSEVESQVRARIADSLWHISTPDLAQALMQLVRAREYGTDRQLLCFALAATKHEDAAEVLASVLDDPAVVGQATEALGKLKAIKYADRILPLLDHREPWIRRTARKSLERMGATMSPSASHQVSSHQRFEPSMPPSDYVEWSTSIDLDDMRYLLSILVNVFNGFSQDYLEEVARSSERMDKRAHLVFQFDGVDDGKGALWIIVRQEDEETVAVHFYAPAELTAKVSRAADALEQQAEHYGL